MHRHHQKEQPVQEQYYIWLLFLRCASKRHLLYGCNSEKRAVPLTTYGWYSVLQQASRSSECSFHGLFLVQRKKFTRFEEKVCIGVHARDCYTGETYDDIRVPNLDHIVELHLLRDCYDLVSGTTETKRPLFSIVRSTANEIQNLNFTSEVLNQAKHCAVKSFCEDFGSKKCHSDGIRYYFSRKGFDEDVCSRMMEQIHISMDFMTPILNEHEEMVGNMYSMMDRMML